MAIAGKWDQLGYDLINGWLPAFEGFSSPTSEFTTIFGDPMPVDRQAYVSEVIDLYTAGLLLIDEVREKLEKVGYKYSQTLTDQLMAEQMLKNQAALGDPYASSLDGTGSPTLMDTLGGYE